MKGFVVRKAEVGSKYPYDIKLEDVKLKEEKGQLLVKVSASALNHRDNWITQGMYGGIKEGYILGADGVGIVVSEDSNMKGKRVVIDPSVGWGRKSEAAPKGKLAIIGNNPLNGTFATHIYIPAENLRLAPEFLTDVQAAALPLAGVTAYRAVVTKGKCAKGSLVLVTGIGGGVATLAVQIATALGARVYVTSSSQNKIDRAIKELGATGGVNYKEQGWVDNLLQLTKKQKFDVIIDGAGDISSLLRLCNGGARLVTYGSTSSPNTSLTLPVLFLNNVEILGTAMGSPEDFDGLIKLVNEKRIVPVVDEVFPFLNFPKALDKMREGAQFGKLVLSHL